MYVLCDDCHNHYDDVTQVAECGVEVSFAGLGVYSNHALTDTPASIETHKWAIESLYGKPGRNPRMTGESWPKRRTPKGSTSPSAAPTSAAGGSVVPFPHPDRSNR